MESVIVVGVDGSPHSRAALLWAARQARLTGSALWAVMAWEYPRLGPDIEADHYALSAGRTLAETVTHVLGQDRDIEVREIVEAGHPAQVLIDAAAGAQLLVVGSRGHGGFAGALLGSVSQHCAQHASCPVVIVRDGA
jgi:nucleotide-binding universal stress UspA family protein